MQHSRIKTCTKVYKIIPTFIVVFCIFYHIDGTEVSIEKNIDEDTSIEDTSTNESEDLLRLNNKDITNLCARIAKQTAMQIVGGNSGKNLTSISCSMDEIYNSIVQLQKSVDGLTASFDVVKSELEHSINNLLIAAQLSLINTTAATPALIIPLKIINAGPEVATYNAHIKIGLAAVAKAVIDQSKTNTVLAQLACAAAIHDLNNVMINDNVRSVLSCYSVTEINNALMQLNSQLAYLNLLQSSH